MFASLFQIIDNSEDLKDLQRIYNNLPSEAHLISPSLADLSYEEKQRAKIYTRERMNALRGKE